MNEIEEILNNKENYLATDMATFWLDDEEYTAYSDYSFIWELSYNKSPERSQNGSTGNLDTNYTSFLTAHATIDYSLMPITDYRRFKQQFNSKRQFMGKFYDSEYNKIITKQVYIATPSMPKFRTITNEDKSVTLIGVDNYKIELIGTNNDD